VGKLLHTHTPIMESDFYPDRNRFLFENAVSEGFGRRHRPLKAPGVEGT